MDVLLANETASPSVNGVPGGMVRAKACGEACEAMKIPTPKQHRQATSQFLHGRLCRLARLSSACAALGSSGRAAHEVAGAGQHPGVSVGIMDGKVDALVGGDVHVLLRQHAVACVWNEVGAAQLGIASAAKCGHARVVRASGIWHWHLAELCAQASGTCVCTGHRAKRANGAD